MRDRDDHEVVGQHRVHQQARMALHEGAPHLEFHGRAADVVQSLGITRAHLSLSHGREHAVAMVVLERD